MQEPFEIKEEQEIESMLKESGNPHAPRLTPALIDSVIKKAEYHVFPDTTVTTCLLYLVNGAKVLGVNYGSISVENQNWEIGKTEAYKNAREKVWELEGYLLRQNLHQVAVTVPV